MSHNWCVLFICVLWLYYNTSAKKENDVDKGCGFLPEGKLIKLIDRKKKSEVVNWTLNVIHYSSAGPKAKVEEYIKTLRSRFRPVANIPKLILCPKMKLINENDHVSAIKKNLCDGLQDRKKGVFHGMFNKNQIAYSIQGKVTSNLLVQRAEIHNFQRKSVEYLVHTITSLGIPTITWFAGSVGNIDMEESPMLLHLEPGAYHVAEAIVDFLMSYKWNVVTVVMSKKLPGYQLFLKELKRVGKERQDVYRGKLFKLDISSEFYIDEVHDKKLINKVCRKYNKPGTSICPVGGYDRLLKEILRAEARVIIFHGTKTDLFFFSYFYEKYNATLFGKKYVWIVTPAATKLATVIDDKQPGHEANLKAKVKLPGMFGFAYDSSITALENTLKYAADIWTKAMKEVVDYVLEERKFKGNATGLSKILIPDFSCTDLSKKMYWKLGKILYQKMKNATFKNKMGQTVGFLDNGYVNTTELFIMNSRGGEISTRWHKVGTWSISDKWSKQKSHLQIDGITFSGGSNQPPSGIPKKVILKVATLKERPFIVYSMPSRENTCDQNTIECFVNPASMNTTEAPLQSEFASTENLTNSTKACCGGLTIDLLLEIKRDLNFEVRMFEVEDRTWGIKTSKGWNGLVKVLLEKKADMVVTSFKITPNRSAVVDFSIPFQETGITIAVALREGKISHTAFLEPYDFSSWCVILIFSVHACGAALFVYEWLSPQGLDRGNVAPRAENDGPPDRDHRFSLFRSLWLIWSMLFSASVNADNPRGVASRVLASIWALFALVFLASYTANLAAFMIAKEEYYDLKSIKDGRLMNPWNQKPPFRFATVPSGATEENIRINFPSMALYMQTYNKSSVTEGIKALKNGEIDAFIYDAYVLDYLEAHDENCKLKTVRNWFAMTGYGIAFPKKSKWLKKVNDQILAYQKNGKMQRWKKFWLSGNCKKSDQLGNTNKTLGVKNFISAFILLVGGMILCTVLLILEHAFYRYMRPRIKSWDKYGCCGLVSISMGQLLSFEQSVNQTVDLIKHHKCKNPICETQLWKARHELDMARRKIRKLETAWNRSAVEQEMAAAAAIAYSSPQTSASIPALPSAPPDSSAPIGATGLCRSETPEMDFHARSEPALNEDPNPLCLCHLNNPPYPLDDAASEHSRLLPPALPPRVLAAQQDWTDNTPASVHYPRPPLVHSRHQHHHPHDPYACDTPPIIRRPKSSGNIAVNHKYNPPEYEMIEKESVL